MISFLGVLFMACISIFFINLFSQKEELVRLISFGVLIVMLFFVSLGIANLFTERPNISMGRNILLYSIVGLVIIIIVQYYYDLPRTTLSDILIGIICLFFVCMLVHSTITEAQKQVTVHFFCLERKILSCL